MIIKGNRPNCGRVKIGFTFGKTVKGVQGWAKIVQVTRVEDREGLHPLVHYLAEWEARK